MSRSRTRGLAAVGIALVAAVLAAGSAGAQTATGVISGTVIDPQKSVVPGRP